MTALIVLVYFDRPNMVRYALESIRDLTTDRWHLAFIDDGSITPGQPIVQDVLRDHADRTWFYLGNDSEAVKRAQNGSRHGEAMTAAIRDCPGDIVTILCDDDALIPDGLEKVLDWYTDNPEAMYSWSRVRTFDPFQGKPGPHVPPRADGLNRHQGTISPSCMVDSSQVTFRASAVRDDGCHYPALGTCALDASMFEQLQERYGLCPANGIELQYKAEFDDQMGNRPVERRFQPRDLP